MTLTERYRPAPHILPVTYCEVCKRDFATREEFERRCKRCANPRLAQPVWATTHRVND